MLIPKSRMLRMRVWRLSFQQYAPPPPLVLQSEDVPDVMGRFAGFVVAYIHRTFSSGISMGLYSLGYGCGARG